MIIFCFILFYFLSSADRSYGLEYPRRGGEVLCDAMKHHQCNSDSLYMCFLSIQSRFVELCY